MQTRTSSPRSVSVPSYALLRCEDLRLLLPQQDIRLLELASDMVSDAPPPGGIGWITFRQRTVPVYVLSPQMLWVTTPVTARPICALLESAGRVFGMLCDEAGLVRADQVTLHEVPSAMVAAQAPFDQLALHRDQLCCVTSAAQLLDYLPATAQVAS